MIPVDVLRSLPLFEGFSEAELADLQDVFQVVAFGAGEVIFSQGDHPERLFILWSGRVAIRFKPYDGEALTVAVIEPGGVFGWSAALDRVHYTSCAVAEEAVQALAITRRSLRRLYHGQPAIGALLLERMAAVLAERLHDTRVQVYDLLVQGMGARPVR